MPEAAGRVHAFPLYAELSKTQVIRNLRLHIPKELREQNSFLVFRLEPGPKKKRKVPYYVRSGTRRHGEQGTPADIREMATFSEALRAYEHKKYDGIGFATLGRVPFTMLDLDNCFDPETGEVSNLAEEVLSWGSYAEFSIGGRGLRVLFRGNLKQNSKNLRMGLELFCTRGFVTLTGMPFGTAKEPKELTEEQVLRLRELVTFNEQDEEGEAINIPSPLNDDRLKDVTRALKAVDPDLDYQDWVKIGQCLHSGDPAEDGEGFKLWLKWSSKGDKFANTNEEDMLRKWKGFHAGRGVTLATIFHIAKGYGYTGKKPQWAKSIPGTMSVEMLGEIQQTDLQPLATGLFDNVGAYMLIGRSKVGKSRLIGAMMVAALTGGKFFCFPFLKKCKILCMPLEERSQDVVDRLEQYMIDPKDHKDQLMFVDEQLLLKNAKAYSEDIDYIQYLDRLLTQCKPDLVYLDTWIKLKVVWRNDPESMTGRPTEQDYEMSASLQELAVKHQCVILFSVHGSKRKGVAAGPYDVFDSIGTTSWAMAGAAGALVMSDMPNYNALDPDSDATDALRRILSVRGRFTPGADRHLLLENRPSGIIVSLGNYADAVYTQRQDELLEALANMGAGEEWVTATSLAESLGISRRAVHGLMHRIVLNGTTWHGARIVARQNRGYRLESSASSGISEDEE